MVVVLYAAYNDLQESNADTSNDCSAVTKRISRTSPVMGMVEGIGRRDFSGDGRDQAVLGGGGHGGRDHANVVEEINRCSAMVEMAGCAAVRGGRNQHRER